MSTAMQNSRNGGKNELLGRFRCLIGVLDLDLMNCGHEPHWRSAIVEIMGLIFYTPIKIACKGISTLYGTFFGIFRNKVC